MSLPTITVIGNMKRIETKVTSTGKQVTSFSIECAEKNAKGEWTNLYLKGECWDKQAEFVNQYFQEGSVAIVTGKLFTNVYEKQDGTKVYETKLLFPSVSFAPKDKAGNQQAQTQQQGYQAPQQNYNQQQPSAKQTMPQNNIPEINIDEDEIPFAPIGLQYPRSLYVI